MGDISNMNDIERLMRSQEGQEELEKIRQMLLGRTIKSVEFSNEVHCIATTLRFDDGETFVVFQPSLDLDAIRDEFADVLERERLIDYPDRKPD